MAFELFTQIEIDAPVSRVWALLMDFTAYPSWNPFIVSIAGVPDLASKLTVRMRPPGGRIMTFKPHVTRLAVERSFAWRGSLPIPGLFMGEHRFELIPVGAGKVRLEHSEAFSGLLLPLLKTSLDSTTRRGFEAMNVALKARAEAN